MIFVILAQPSTYGMNWLFPPQLSIGKFVQPRASRPFCLAHVRNCCLSCWLACHDNHRKLPYLGPNSAGHLSIIYTSSLALSILAFLQSKIGIWNFRLGGILIPGSASFLFLWSVTYVASTLMQKIGRRLHALSFIRNPVKFSMVLFLICFPKRHWSGWLFVSYFNKTFL